MANMEAINILISFDQEILAEGIAAILLRDHNLRVSAMVKNQKDLLDSIKRTHPDFLILEFCDLYPERIDFVKQIRREYQTLKLMVVSSPVSRFILDDLMHHINGFMVRSSSSEKVLQAIYEIAGNGKYLCPKTIETLFAEDNYRDLISVDLTLREKEVLSLWVNAENNGQIAEQLNISQTTVRTHLKNIHEKFGHGNQIQMMIYACKENLLNGQFRPICPNCRSYCFLSNS